MYKTLKAPLSLQIEVTGRCNIKCIHCYNFWKGDEKDKCHINMMTKETAEKLFDEILRYGVKSLVITGGEPLLNFDIVYMILDFASKNSIHITMNSNLICLNDEVVLNLRELGLKNILTSFMGSCPEIYETVSGVKGSFEKAVSGISCALKNGFNVTCNMVTTKLNVHDIYSTAKFLKGIGVNGVCMTLACAPAGCNEPGRT